MTPMRKKRDSALPSTDTGALKWYHINKRTKVIEWFYTSVLITERTRTWSKIHSDNENALASMEQSCSQSFFLPTTTSGAGDTFKGISKKAIHLEVHFYSSERSKCVQQFNSSASTVKNNSFQSPEQASCTQVLWLLGHITFLPISLWGRNSFPSIS